MSRIKQIIRQFKETVEIVKNKNPEKSKLYIALDLFLNMLFRPISFPDYRKCDYINASKEEKDLCINKKEYEKFVKYMDDSRYTFIFVDKIMFNFFFSDMIGRNYIDIRQTGKEGLKKFVKGKDSVFAKVKDDFGGHGISKIKNFDDVDGLYEQFMKNKQYLIEDTLLQHDVLNEINPNAVNNIRLSTVVKDGEVHLVTNTLRLNTGGDAIISSDDIMVNIADDGTLVSDAVDEKFEYHETHPDTGTKIKGIKIPYYKEAVELVKKAALRVPEIRYVGWDVAITPDGPALIEGNFYPSYGLTQFYLLNPDYPLKARFRKIMGDELDQIFK